jgi:hypothetical protein
VGPLGPRPELLLKKRSHRGSPGMTPRPYLTDSEREPSGRQAKVTILSGTFVTWRQTRVARGHTLGVCGTPGWLNGRRGIAIVCRVRCEFVTVGFVFLFSPFRGGRGCQFSFSLLTLTDAWPLPHGRGSVLAGNRSKFILGGLHAHSYWQARWRATTSDQLLNLAADLLPGLLECFQVRRWQGSGKREPCSSIPVYQGGVENRIGGFLGIGCKLMQGLE